MEIESDDEDESDEEHFRKLEESYGVSKKPTELVDDEKEPLVTLNESNLMVMRIKKKITEKASKVTGDKGKETEKKSKDKEKCKKKRKEKEGNDKVEKEKRQNKKSESSSSISTMSSVSSISSPAK